MISQPDKEIEFQRRYYRETAQQYDQLHVHEKDEHFFALAFLVSILDHVEATSVLDIGSGTGRALQYIKERRPDLRLIGIEPVDELRNAGHANGISKEDLIAGDATHVQFADNHFDVVCEFGVLHHVKKPELIVAEMLRVARKAIFISDSNNFGQGSLAARSFKQFLNSLGLWNLVNYIKTRGKGYTLSKEDGLAYSYSVFNNYNQVKSSCKSIHVLNTTAGGVNPYRSAGHVALLGIK